MTATAIQVRTTESITGSQKTVLPIDIDRLKALILDVDGTLYRQTQLRRSMLCRLLSETAKRPAEGLLTLRVLHAYRKAQEVLRAPSDYRDIAEEQLRLTSEWTRVAPDTVRACVERWMELEPLQLLRSVAHEGVTEFLHVARNHGLRLGIFSDYPAISKLAAMGIAELFDVVVTAQDPEVQKFKPSPRGLEVTLRRLGVAKHEAIYIGDRPEIDRAAASSAGMGCVILGSRNGWDPRGWLDISGYSRLTEALENHRQSKS